MDNLTHSLVGVLFGQMGLKCRTGLAVPTLVIAANLPDIDATCLPYGMQSLAMRRGITHGPIAIVVLPLLLAGTMLVWDRWRRQRGKRRFDSTPVRFGWLLALAFLGCISHSALDWLNNYGIRLLEPFSDRWFYGDTLFIVDIWFWLALIASVWLSLRRERAGDVQWRRPAWIGFAAISAYIFANGLITGHAEKQAMDLLTAARGRAPELVVANTLPIAFWRREMLWRDGTAFGSGDYAVAKATRFGPEQQNLYGVIDLKPLTAANPDARALLFWSRMAVVELRGDKLRISDQRFNAPIADGSFSLTVPAP